MPGLIEREFAGNSHSPGAARAFAKAALGELFGRSVPPQLCDDMELVVSELVTNAIRAGTKTVHVAVELVAARLTVSVTDFAGGWPEERVAGVQEIGGRGLPLVSAVSRTWGVRLVGSGKVVWADLAVPPAR